MVIGASIAGLTAARAISPHFDHVTIVERDELKDEPGLRRGVPQGSHLHAFKYGGRVILDELYGTFTDELCSHGAPLFDFPRYMASRTPEGWLKRAPTGLEVIFATRPLNELVVRRLTQRDPDIEFQLGTVTGLIAANGGRSVSGVKIKESGGIRDADLVIDASGRGSKSVKWIGELGFAPPEQSVVKPFLGYATCFAHLPADAWPGDIRCIGAGPLPGVTRGGFVIPLEDELFGIMAAGQSRDYPPSDPKEFSAFLETATTPMLKDLWQAAEPVSEIMVTKTSQNVLRRWHELKERPGRFLVVGDAMAAFNPVYGQGMTAAATQARALRKRLAELDSLDEVVEVFQAEVMDVSAFAWAAATQADIEFKGTEVRNVDRQGSNAEARGYFRQARGVATIDAWVAQKFHLAMHWMQPDPLLEPEVRERVQRLAASIPRRSAEELAYPPLHSDSEPGVL